MCMPGPTNHHMLQTEEEVLDIVEDDPSTSTREIARQVNVSQHKLCDSCKMSSYYKYCIVPQCKSTTIKTPNKLFIYVPTNEQIRKKWLKLARGMMLIKANTIKYLISCTPNGLVNYISPGFEGRITDTCLVESCDFVKTLKNGMCVMADRGFKHVEPASVETGVKMSKSEAELTKQIASLRIRIERVIRRLREFYMLKPHACINFKFFYTDIVTDIQGEIESEVFVFNIALIY
ncbi:hypothetical protein NQ317_013948 [Molorchus minor]|uniref:DDE Tnp4 domain-containing protein n=1 Tax=Molorchus minor TaxID=1323400 RepID=A0ABQ9JXS2_9CUCU|nr:hypothetical protein NQ317_013948 [Molorchus minor]